MSWFDFNVESPDEVAAAEAQLAVIGKALVTQFMTQANQLIGRKITINIPNFKEPIVIEIS